MKKLSIATLLVALIGFGVYSCSKQGQENTPQILKPNLERLSLKTSVFYDRMFLPDGTDIDSSSSGVLTFTAPNGWQYVYELNEDNTAYLDGVYSTVTCKCNGKTGSCIAVYHRKAGIYDCMNGDCQEGCEKIETTANGVNFSDIRQGGFIDFNAPVRAMVLGEELPSAFPAMFNLSLAKNKLDSLKTEIYGSANAPTFVKDEDGVLTAPTGHTFVYMSAFGRGFAMIVPLNKMEKISGSSAVSTETIVCTCNPDDEGNISGTCRISYDGAWVFCSSESDCTTGGCTLSVGSKRPEDQLVSLVTYRY